MTFGKFIGYGILVFLIGEFGAIWIDILAPLKAIGLLLTSFGIYLWFKTRDMAEEFGYENDGVLTYFWNKIVLKFWTFIFLLWMLFSTLFWIIGGTFK